MIEKWSALPRKRLAISRMPLGVVFMETYHLNLSWLVETSQAAGVTTTSQRRDVLGRFCHPWPKRKVVFQPSIFQGVLLVSGRVSTWKTHHWLGHWYLRSVSMTYKGVVFQVAVVYLSLRMQTPTVAEIPGHKCEITAVNPYLSWIA